MEDIHSLLIDAPAPTGLFHQLTARPQKHATTLTGVVVVEYIHSLVFVQVSTAATLRSCLGFITGHPEFRSAP